MAEGGGVECKGYENKKLGCRRETARCFTSMNISLSHSRSFEMTFLRKARVPTLVFHCNYVCNSSCFWDIQQVRGRSRSLKVAPFDKTYTTFYWSSVVTTALSCTIFELFVNNIVTLKCGLRDTHGYWKKYHWKGWGFLFAFHSNYGCILYRFWDIATYWSKIAIFSYSLAFDAPVRGSP